MTDFRLAARTLARSPGFALVAVLLLALGIGSNAVIFGALEAILLRPLPVRHPQQLVRFVQDIPRLGRRSGFGLKFYETLRDHSTTLAAAFGEAETDVAMASPAPAEEVRVNLVTPEYYDVLNAPAVVGRVLSARDAEYSGDAPPAVLSYGFWQRRFAGDRQVLGRPITLHGHAFTIVGVQPREFNGISVDTAPDIRVPMRAGPLLSTGRLENRQIDLSARMKPGVARQRALAEVQALWNATLGKDPDEWHQPIEADSLEHGVSVLRQRFSGALQLLIASVALLQLMVCANLAGLLLARGARRSGDVAVRLALGATRWRLARQMLVESALVTLVGAAGGVALAYAAAPLLVRGLPPIRDLGTTRLALAIDFRPDGRVLLYSLAVSGLTALLFGMAPAVAAARTSLEGVLRSARSAGGWRGRQVLLVLQIALCTLLLAGAGLLVRSFRHLRFLDPGFSTARVVTFTANPLLNGYNSGQVVALQHDLAEKVRQIPGVELAALASRGVMRGSGVKTTVAPAGQRVTEADFMNASFNSVSPGYFDTMGMRLLAGRDLRESDGEARKAAPVPVVVNQTFVRRFFPQGNPLGRRFGNGAGVVGEGFEIVGVVNDAHYRSLREPVPATFYTILGNGDFTLCVRTRARPEDVISPVRQALASLDSALPFVEIHTLAEEVGDSAAPERLTASLAAIFAVLAAMLAAVGLYGLLAYAVTQRRREIGIRMALGARPGSIAGLVGGQALGLVAVGVVLGLGGARLLGPLAASLLYGVGPADAMSLAGAAIVVASVAMLAAVVPAVRASRYDPASALRE